MAFNLNLTNDDIDKLSQRLMRSYKIFDCYILADQNLHELYNKDLKRISQERLKDDRETRKLQRKHKSETNSENKGLILPRNLFDIYNNKRTLIF